MGASLKVQPPSHLFLGWEIRVGWFTIFRHFFKEGFCIIQKEPPSFLNGGNDFQGQ